MKKKSLRIVFLCMVLFFGLVANVFVTPNVHNNVQAEHISYDKEYHTSGLKLAYADTISDLVNNQYEDTGSHGSEYDYVVYEYFVNGTCLNEYRSTLGIYYHEVKTVSVAHNTTYNYTIKRKNVTFTGKSTSFLGTTTYKYKVAEDKSFLVEGSFTVGFYSYVNVEVSGVPEGQNIVPEVIGAENFVDNEGYKVYYGNDIEMSFPEIEDYDLYINGERTNTCVVSGVTEDTTVSVVYEKITDNKIIIDSATKSLLSKNGGLSSLVVTLSDGTNMSISSNTDDFMVPESSIFSITATPNNKNLVAKITISDGENVVEYVNESDDRVFVTSDLETGIDKDYVISVELESATNTLSIIGGGYESANFKYTGDLLSKSLTDVINRDSEITVAIVPNNYDYIVDWNIVDSNGDEVDCDGSISKGKLTITLTTSAKQNYVINLTTNTMVESANNANINMYDIVAMLDGDVSAKVEVYDTLWYDAYSVNANIDMSEVKFEYLAGIYPFDTSSFLGSLGSVYDIEFYYPIDKPLAVNGLELCEYIHDYISGISSTIGNLISANTLYNNIDSSILDSIIASLHNFGTQSNETVKMTYDGNDTYQSFTLLTTINCLDLREEVRLDINEKISVAFGSYSHSSYIMEKILDGKYGVVNQNGEPLDLNSYLVLSSDMVGKDVGTYTIIVTFPNDNYTYKGITSQVTLEIEKAEVLVDVTNNILNYQNTSNNPILKEDIVSIVPQVEFEYNVDHIYFVMGLDVVNGELITNLDLTNMSSSNSKLEQLALDTAIKSALKIADPENDGLTLAEFVNFALSLSKIMGMDGANIDNSYIDKLTELLNQANDTINIRIKVSYGDNSNIVPQNPGIYLVGVVTTDTNFNINGDAGYLVITPEIVDMKFVGDTSNNNLKRFEYDGTPKQMLAEAYDVNNQLVSGDMIYYYIGIQLDGKFYASNNAPINAGSYSVFVIFSNAKEDNIPSRVGFSIGAMVIVPSGKIDMSIEDTAVCYDGQPHNISFNIPTGAGHIILVNSEDTLNIILPASWNIDFSKEYALITEKLNQITAKLEKYLPESYLEQLKLEIQNIIETYGIKAVVINQTLPVELGEYELYVVAYDFNHEITIGKAILNISNHNTIYHEGKSATCIEDGWKAYYTCKDCDYTTYESISALGHTEVEDAEVLPTCTTDGLTAGVHCSVCCEILIKQEVVSMLGHNLKHYDELMPTCTELGHHAYDICLDCDYTTYESISALGHTETADAEVLPTCTTNGLTAGSHCAVCNEILVQQEIVDMLGHSLVHHEGKSATCTEDGHNAYDTCEICEYTTYETVLALGHTEVEDVEVLPTCTTAGLTAGMHCSVCCEILVAQKVVPMLGHTLLHYEVVVPTCTEDGHNAYEMCTVCDYTTYVYFPELGHTEVKDLEVEATCTTAGLTTGTHCSACGEILVAQQVIPMLGHSLIYHEALMPTCTESGHSAYNTCTECNYTTYVSLPALGHTEVEKDAVAATCTSTGLTLGVHCSVCNEILVQQEVIPMLGHSYGEWYVEIPATATTDGRYTRVCDCGHSEHKVIEAYGDKNVGNVEITESEDGKANVNSESIKDALKEVEETGNKEVVISVSNSSTVLTSVEMGVTSLQEIVNADTSLTIETTNVYATFDKKALSNILSSTNGAEDIEFDLRVVEQTNLNEAQQEALTDLNVAGVISASILCGDNIISNFGEGTVKVRIPFAIAEGKSASNYKIMYVADDGSMEELTTTYVNGELVVDLNHFSEYVIVEVPNASPSISVWTIIIFVLVVLLLLVVPVLIDASVFVKNERRK